MNKSVDKWIEDHRDEMIADLQTLVRYRSVYEEGCSRPGMPFGEENYKCLEAALAMGRKMGFETDNVDGYAGSIKAGEGEKTLGILAHLDVVPESSGWDHDPYGAEIIDGNIFGRGTIDDKGPAIAALYALKAVSECGLKFKNKVNIILGCNEESGMECLEYYKKNRPIPDFSFSPDGEYPLTNSEKSCSVTLWKKEYKSGIRLKAGTVHNAVPSEATAEVPLAMGVVRAAAEMFAEDSPFGVAVTAGEEGTTKIKLIGETAHASMPETGLNAIQGMLELLSALPLGEEDSEAVKSLHELLGMDVRGEGFGLDITDESGRMTFNVGIMDWDEGGYEITFDMRVPLSLTEEQLEEALREGMEAAGARPVKQNWSQGYSIPDDEEFVRKLTAVFRERTGEDWKPKHIGGGTYARHLPNAVSFGIEGYMCPASAHVANEYIGIDQLVFNCKMMADAIMALACE